MTDRLDYFPKEFKFNNIYDDPDDLDKDKKDLSKDLVEYRQKIQEMLEKEKLQ